MLNNLLSGVREHEIISNATLPNAAEFLDKIKYNLKYNELLNGLFSHVVPEDPEAQAERWTQSEIQLCGNKVETGSVEGNLVSRHYQVMIHDDLVNKENSATSDQIAKVIDWWKLSQSLLLAKGIEIIIGTRWSMDDLYGHLIDKFMQIPEETMKQYKTQPIWEHHTGKWHMLQVSCWEDPVNRRGSTFPTLFPESRLHEIEEEQAERFGGQYLNDPLAMSDSVFKPNWFGSRSRWRECDLPTIKNTFLLVDPAGKDKETSDETGLVVYDAAIGKKLYLRCAKRRHITDLRLADWIIEESLVYKPGYIGIEENKFNAIQELIELRLPWFYATGRIIGKTPEETKELREYARTIPYLCGELKPRNRNKKLRIRNLTGPVENGQILFAPTGMHDIIDEFLRFPTSPRDNTIDAAAYIQDVVVYPTEADLPKMPPQFKTQEEKEEDLWDSLPDNAYVGQGGFMDKDVIW